MDKICGLIKQEWNYFKEQALYLAVIVGMWIMVAVIIFAYD